MLSSFLPKKEEKKIFFKKKMVSPTDNTIITSNALNNNFVNYTDNKTAQFHKATTGNALTDNAKEWALQGNHLQSNPRPSNDDIKKGFWKEPNSKWGELRTETQKPKKNKIKMKVEVEGEYQ